MNLLRLALSNLRFHWLASLFNLVVLALGVAMIVTLMRLGDQLADRFSRDLAGIDLVVGAKGSPLQLILSSVFHLDSPTGNIPLEDAETLSQNPLIEKAIPISLGDNFQGFQIVGTTSDYPALYGATLQEGGLWAKPMQAVLGAGVARETGLGIGATFVGSHGLTVGGEEHAAFPYRVVGILAPTGGVIDRLILADVASVWKVHEHPDPDSPDEVAVASAHGGEMPKEVTALLITYRTPLAAVSLPRLVNSSTAMQAASPAFETARLMKLLGAGGDAFRAFGVLLMVIAGVGFFVTLFNAVNGQRYDIALMRSLGATRRNLLGFVLAEGLMLAVLGTGLGLLLGHAFDWIARAWIAASRQMLLTPVPLGTDELLVAAAALIIGFLSALLPAAMAYRTDVARVLSRGSA
jgi:putative ABC transport system permease protein